MLQVEDEHFARYSAHLTYRQTLNGVPVYNRYVKINLDASRRPVMIISGYATHLDGGEGFSTHTRVTEQEATRKALQLLSADAVLHSELVVYPSELPRLAWSFVLATTTGEWEVLIDAESGEPILVLDRPIPAR